MEHSLQHVHNRESAQVDSRFFPALQLEFGLLAWVLFYCRPPVPQLFPIAT